MENDRKTSVPNRPGESARTLAACNLWLCLGFVGASALAIALLRLVDGSTSPAPALAGALAAGLLTTFAWRRSQAVLDRVDVPAATASAPAVPDAFGRGREPLAAR